LCVVSEALEPGIHKSFTGEAVHTRLPPQELVMLMFIRTTEASMHGSFDKSGESDNRIHRNWGIALYALTAVLAVALIVMVIVNPNVSTWVSQAAQAEFVGTDFIRDAAPTRLAKPATEIRTVRAN
jgi:hypothetical protein